MLRVGNRAATVRLSVLAPDGSSVGGGVLLTPTHIATCAHVVAATTGGDPATGAAPDERVAVRFADDTGELPPRSARVARWQPVRPDGTGDIAVLKLDDPVSLPTPPLHRLDRPWGRRFRVTAGAGSEDSVAGELRAAQGTGWTQLRADEGGPPISAGFSGSAVWDEHLGAVVGITVAADFNPARATAYMIPIQDACRLEPTAIRNPYRGLAPFREADARLFHGRDGDIARLAAVLDRERLAVVVGPSGVGKSSLLRAGLLPRLRAAGSNVIDLPVAGAAADPAVAELVTTVDRAGPDAVIVADQFEELLATAPVPVARAVLDRLLRLADDPGRRLRVVLTLRWTELGEVVTAATAGRLDAAMVPVAPLDRTRLREAVDGPTAWAPGLVFDTGLVEQICADAADAPGQLPLVEVVLRQLAANHADGVMSRDAYARLGGVGGAIQRLADAAVADLDSEAGGDPAQVRALLTGLVTIDETGFVRRRRRLADLPASQRRVADEFVRRRLLVVAGGAGPGTDPSEAHVELAHQALIDHWPALRAWLDEDRAYLGWLADTARRRTAWLEAEREPGALLRGTSLAAAREWLADRADVDPDIREYVTASVSHAGLESRRRRLLTGLVAVATGAAVVLGSLAAYQRSVGSAHELASDSRQLAALSTAVAAADPSFSALLALAAHEREPTDEARQALFHHHVEYQAVDAVLSGGFGRISAVDMSADARVVAANTGSGLITVWERGGAGGVTAHRLPATGNVTAFRLTADGSTVYALETFALDSHVVFGHDLAAGERSWEVRLDGVADTLTFGEEQFAAILAGAPDERRTQQLWDVSGPSPRLAAERPEPGPVQEVHGFGPDPGSVVLRSLSAHGGVDLDVWDTASGESHRVAEGVVAAGLGYWVDEHDRVSPDGTTVLCDEPAGQLLVISVVDGATVGRAPLPTGERCRDLAIDDLASVAVGTAAAVDLASGRVIPQRGLRPYLPDDAVLAQVEPLQRARRLAHDGERHLTVLHDSQRAIVTELDLAEPVGADRPVGAGSDAVTDPAGRWLAEQVTADLIAVRALPGLELVAEVEARGPAFDGDLLTTVSGAVVSWWDPATGSLVEESDLAADGAVRPGERMSAVAAHPEPGLLLVAVDGELRTVSPARGDPSIVLPVGADVRRVHSYPGESHILVEHGDGTLVPWDVTAGERGPALVRPGDRSPGGHGGTAVALAEPGTFLVAADGRLSWYEAGSDTPVRTLHLGHDAAGEPRQAVAVSPTGQVVVRDTSTTSTVSLRPADWIETVCGSIERTTFTAAEGTTLPSWALAEPLC